VLEVMLCRPQRVVAKIIHEPRDVACSREDLTETLVGITAFIGRRALKPDIVEVDLTDIQSMESFDHVSRSFNNNDKDFSRRDID
jgi:hypothetical protein